MNLIYYHENFSLKYQKWHYFCTLEINIISGILGAHEEKREQEKEDLDTVFNLILDVDIDVRIARKRKTLFARMVRVSSGGISEVNSHNPYGRCARGTRRNATGDAPCMTGKIAYRTTRRNTIMPTHYCGSGTHKICAALRPSRNASQAARSCSSIKETRVSVPFPGLFRNSRCLSPILLRNAYSPGILPSRQRGSPIV